MRSFSIVLVLALSVSVPAAAREKAGGLKITAKVDGYTQGTQFNKKKYPFKYTGKSQLKADQLKALANKGDVPNAVAKSLLTAALWPGKGDKLDTVKLKSDGKKITGDVKLTHKYGKFGVHTLTFKVEGTVEDAKLTLKAVKPVVSGKWNWGGGSIKLTGKVDIKFEAAP